MPGSVPCAARAGVERAAQLCDPWRRLQGCDHSMDTPQATRPEEAEAEIALVLALGRALHEYGAPAPRLERALEMLTRRFGMVGQFFATPTAIFAAFGPEGQQRISLLRVKPAGVNLGMRVQVDELIGEVLTQQIDAHTAQERLRALLAAPPRLGVALGILCSGLASMCAARFFNGGVPELALSFALGAVTGILGLAAARVERVQRVFEPLAAVVVSALAMLAAHWIAPLSTYTATVCGLIVLLPGLSLTSAMSELAARHLASGSARLMGSAMTFLAIGFGVALGTRVGVGLPPLDSAQTSAGLPSWTMLPALILAPLCFSVLLRARPRDFGWIIIVCILGFLGAREGTQLFGTGIGAALGALVVGATSNLLARSFNRSSAVTVVPGLLLLVPGSLGFQSLSSLLSRDVLSGVETGFNMVLVAISLAAGLLLANVLVPPRHLEREDA
jgi:uncharacterized membrane protein YjjP (DUF1212 family)